MFLGLTIMDEKSRSNFVLCIRNDGAEDLEPRKVYQILTDRPAERDGYARVIDESGEDYLYPACAYPVVSARGQLLAYQSGRAPTRWGWLKQPDKHNPAKYFVPVKLPLALSRKWLTLPPGPRPSASRVVARS